MDKNTAIRVVAANALNHLLDSIDSYELLNWEDYPDLGEADWDEVLNTVRRLGRPQYVSEAEFDLAYTTLKLRAESWQNEFGDQ